MLGGAVDVHMTPINPAPAAMATRRASVEVVTSGSPERPHVDVALLQGEPTGNADDSATNLIGTLRGVAATMGCDALVFTQVDVHPPARSGDLRDVEAIAPVSALVVGREGA